MTVVEEKQKFQVFSLTNSIAIIILSSSISCFIGVIINNPWNKLVSSYLYYGILIIWIIGKCNVGGIELKKMICGKPINFKWYSFIYYSVLPICVQGVVIPISIYGLYIFCPNALEDILNISSSCEINDQSASFITLKIICFVIIAPIVEEVFFRGIVLNSIALKRKNIKIGILVSSLFFGILHGSNCIGAFFIGVIFSIIYIKNRSLLIGTVIHMLNNALVRINEYYDGGETVQSTDILQFSKIEIVVIIFIVIVACINLLYFIIKNWPQNQKKLPYFDEC